MPGLKTPQPLRKSFNGGELAPELHYSSHLEAYHDSCKSMLNMLVTPWGAATRRPPTELLAKFDTALYGVPVKYVPFRFSLSEVFHIIFTDGSGSLGADSETCDMVIYDSAGSMVVLSGADTKILNAVYSPDDINALHFINVNDFIYMTCGGKYPVHFINRYFDNDQADERWKIEEWFIQGLLGDVNLDTTKTLYVHGDGYDDTATYDLHDVVSVGSDDISIVSANWKYKGVPQFAYNDYYLRITVSSGTYAVGESITVNNLVIDGVQDRYPDQVYWGSPSNQGSALYVGEVVSGTYEVVHVSGQTLSLNKVAFAKSWLLESDYPSFDESSATASVVSDVSGVTFYRSLQDANTGQALSSATWWEPIYYYSGILTCESSYDLFTADDVGREIALNIDTNNTISGAWDSNNTSDVINAYGTVELITEGGTWGGTISLQSSKNNGATWETLKSISSNDGSSNGSVEVEISEINTLIRVVLAGWGGTNLTKCKFQVKLKNDVRNHFKIVEYTDARTVTVETITPVLNEVSDFRFQLGVFAKSSGYPFTVAIHDERMVFGGTKTKPNTVWASRVNDWPNFLSGTTEVAPYSFTIKSDSFDSIRWMRSTRNLMLGTDNSESTVGTKDDSKVISTTNIDVQTHTYFGSSGIQAVVTADLVFFVQGQRERVRSTQYDFASDQYQSSEMSLHAHHILNAKVKEMSFRRHPFSNIFFVLDDGQGAVFTYERDNEVKGWTRLDVGGDIISAASNYSDEGDIIAGIVKRGSHYYLESFGVSDSATVYLDNQSTFTDEDYSAGVALPYGDTTGIEVNLNGAKLEAASYTVSSGTLTIPGQVDGTVIVGFPFSWEIEPTDIADLGERGRERRAVQLSLYLLESGGCNVFVNGEESQFEESINLAPGDRLSGEHFLSTGGGWNSSISLKLSGDSHDPFTLLAVGVSAADA